MRMKKTQRTCLNTEEARRTARKSQTPKDRPSYIANGTTEKPRGGRRSRVYAKCGHAHLRKETRTRRMVSALDRPGQRKKGERAESLATGETLAKARQWKMALGARLAEKSPNLIKTKPTTRRHRPGHHPTKRTEDPAEEGGIRKA